MVAKLTALLKEFQPFVLFVALLFGVLGAWLALADIIPVLKQVWVPKGTAQSYAIVGACLAIIAGHR
ncbi:MAG: hypothetical protein AB7O43_18360 [Hyphomicrobiaceae bacterium]